MRDETSGSVAGIVLAAGDSTRMGRNKLLLALGGTPVVRRAVQNAIDAGLDPVCVVLGFEAAQMRDALSGLAYEEIVNAEHRRGINRSVQLGIAAVRERASAAVVLLADMPLVTRDMIAAVVGRYKESRAQLVVSRYGDVRAPPTLYDRALFDEFTEDEGEGCGKRIVKKHLHEASWLDWPVTALNDLDDPEDYERMKTLIRETVS